jgi:pimeloyl-ACP methyl ester carboxylesterase
MGSRYTDPPVRATAHGGQPDPWIIPEGHRVGFIDEFIYVSEYRLHLRRIDGDVTRSPILFLHEGLGSVDRWRDYPADVASQSGNPALLYSRAGNGWSDPIHKTRGRSYLHREALEVLPELVGAHIERPPVMVGHSDGASIAIIYSGAGHDAAGLVLIAPHVFVEDDGLESIRAIHDSFPSSDLAEKMAKYHVDPESTFHGWAGAWLDPEFRSWNIEECLEGIRCPVLLIQCEEDEYGSLRQLDAIEARVAGPTQRVVLPGPGHSPHLAHPEAVTDVTVRFIASLS